uniref:Cysteine protease n=1 Tax=Plectus sambesii TaxID=2011161 RepID=A0A914WMV6_9BILA
MHRRIVALFGDSPTCDLSLHAMMAVARAKHTPSPVGKWFAPSTAVALMRDTLSNSSDPLLADTAMLVATDCCLARSDVIEASAKWTKSLLIVVCLRLGAEKINRCYHRHIRTLMSMRCCVGIVGGRPKHSVYFVGAYHKHLIFLDPHFVQDTVPVDPTTEFPLKTFHCRLPGKLPLAEMDPSCAIGFFVQSESDFERMIGDLSEVIELEDDRRKGIVKQDPLFTLVDERQGRFEGSEDAKDASLVAQARQHGFELL